MPTGSTGMRNRKDAFLQAKFVLLFRPSISGIDRDLFAITSAAGIQRSIRPAARIRMLLLKGVVFQPQNGQISYESYSRNTVLPHTGQGCPPIVCSISDLMGLVFLYYTIKDAPKSVHPLSRKLNFHCSSCKNPFNNFEEDGWRNFLSDAAMCI